jgi:nitroreductase
MDNLFHNFMRIFEEAYPLNEKLTPEVKKNRKPENDVDAQFLNRWSPRAFSEQEVTESVLMSIFDAAHWAPSGSNEQPWRFIFARTKQQREKFYPFINEFNRTWCEKAPVLIVMASKTLNAKGSPHRSHAFDTGTAWGHLALAASNKGLCTHAMGGFDPLQARSILNVPDEYELHAVVALGYRGEIESLSERDQEREKPSVRRPLAEFILEGGF